MAYEAGTAYLSVVPSFRGGARQIADQFSGPMNRAGVTAGQTFGQGTERGFVTGSRGLVTKVAGIAAAVGLQQVASEVVGYFRESIDAAATMGETQSKLNQIFGDSTRIISDYANDSTKNILLTRQAALDGAATFGIFAKGAGLAGDEAAGFSVEMVNLAADMASFNNTSPEQAIQAIGAALRGESEPIRAYGVLLDDATLKQRAVTMGIYDGTGALSQQQRVLAAHAEILAQTSLQQGDAARTADSFANRQRQVQKAMEDTKVEIGEALLPVVNDLMGIFMDVGVPALKELAAWFTENQESIKRFILISTDMGLLFLQSVIAMVRMWAQFQDGFITVADNVLRFWFTVADGILRGAEKAFGWIPGVGERLKGARRAFDETRSNAESNLGRIRASADTVTRGVREGERSVQDLRSAVQRIDGMTSTVRVRLDLPRYSAADIPGSSAWLAARGIPVQARAHGGPVVAGRPYLVGERGPELIVPRTSGTVLTAGDTSRALSGGGVSVNFNGPVSTHRPEELASVLVRRQRDALVSNGVAGLAALA